MIKMYEVLPTAKLVNLPPNYYEALHKRFEYVFVEVGRGQDLLSAPKNCEKCYQWCASSDSIQCLKCEKNYHLLCLDPPIFTKPKRGFAWFCAACNHAMEDALSAKRGKLLTSSQPHVIAAQAEASSRSNSQQSTSSSQSGTVTNSVPSSSQEQHHNPVELPKYEQLAIDFLKEDKGVSFKKRRELEEWPFRYLGMHAKLEDALDIQDRPYARAASRLGSRHQFTGMVDWFNHPVQYYDTDSAHPSKNKGGRRKRQYGGRWGKRDSTSPSPEDEELQSKKMPIPKKYQSLNVKEFPGWLQPKPKGFIERGGDDTVKLLWKPIDDKMEPIVEKYVNDCEPVAKKLNIIPTTPNFMDAILKILMDNDYDTKKSLEEVSKLTRETLKEPTFSEEEVHKFEEAVKIHGSELHPVFKSVGTQTSAMIVRFYYLWKKTPNGHLIWDNYPGRAKNRLKNTKNIGLDLGDAEDDAAFSTTKINKVHAHFECAHCKTDESSQWFRTPGISLPDSVEETCYGLCRRCASLWRRYGARWEEPSDSIRKQAQKGGSGWKKRTEFELIQDSLAIIDMRDQYRNNPKKFVHFKKEKSEDPVSSSEGNGERKTS
ncbi:unnamed protein product [Ambrosiozyma monospora]|uniref:Unnamed protein product n=1 Tax=Ambrosiozyma monospora TaxID=43982 RepID=A0ACB5TBR0_AMBMO|nr:unnamed protein product [Ambrosiozyma monospora]